VADEFCAVVCDDAACTHTNEATTVHANGQQRRTDATAQTLMEDLDEFIKSQLG
jgi:hypothetical protein